MTNVSNANAANVENDSLGTNKADFGLKSKFWDFVPPILMSWRRLEMWQEKNEMARLMPELRTSPLRFAQQMRSTNQPMRIEEPPLDSIFRHILGIHTIQVFPLPVINNATHGAQQATPVHLIMCPLLVTAGHLLSANVLAQISRMTFPTACYHLV